MKKILEESFLKDSKGQSLLYSNPSFALAGTSRTFVSRFIPPGDTGGERRADDRTVTWTDGYI